MPWWAGLRSASCSRSTPRRWCTFILTGCRTGCTASARNPIFASPPRSESNESLSLFQIRPQDRHLEIIATFILLVVDEHHADKLFVDIDFGRIVFFRTRHDTQLGVAEQASHIIFQLADFRDVHGRSFAPLASRGVPNLHTPTAISARQPMQTQSP